MALACACTICSMEDKTTRIARAKLLAECLPDERQAVMELEALC